MADAIRLFAEFTDDLGNDYRLNIHQNGWQVTPFEFNLGGDGFTLRYSGDNENRMQPIIGSELTFTLTENDAQHTLFIEALATSQDAEFTVSVYKDPDGANTLFWVGVMLSEQIELMDEAYPIQNTFNAVDELGNLANTLYNNNGVAFPGRDNIAQHLYKCILKTRALHIYDSTDVLIRYANNFYPTTDFLSVNALIESEVNHSAYYNQNEQSTPEFYTVFAVLEDLATTFNARVFFADGVFNFIPIGALIDDEELDLFTITKAGTVSASATAISTELIVQTDVIKLRGGSQTFLAPLNDVRRTWVTNANLPVLFDTAQFLQPLSGQIAMGTVISDASLLYEADTELRLQFQFEYNYSGGGSFTGQDVPGRIALRFLIECGGLYYVNALTFGPGSFSSANWQDAYTLTNMNFSAPAWSASPGYFYIPVTPQWSYIDRNTGQIVSPQAFSLGGNTIHVLSNNQPLIIDLEAISTEQTGLEVSAIAVGYSHNGTIITDITGSGAYGKLSNTRVFVMNGEATNGDEIIYNANTANAGQISFEQTALIGSSTFNTHKNIFDNGEPGEVIDEWGGLLYPTEDAAIHTLGVKEILAGQNNSTPVKRGSFFSAFVSPFNTLNFDSDRYLPFETSFTARSVECDYEAFKLILDNADIVTPQPEIIDTHEPQDDSEPVYDLRNSYSNDAGNLAPNIFQRFIQQPVTEIENRNGASYDVRTTDYMIMNVWAGPNGSSAVYLPSVTGNEGRSIQFHSDSTISANTYVSLRPSLSDSGVTIDGASSYNFNRAYDGITILCHDSNWFIIQKKEK